MKKELKARYEVQNVRYYDYGEGVGRNLSIFTQHFCLNMWLDDEEMIKCNSLIMTVSDRCVRIDEKLMAELNHIVIIERMKIEDLIEDEQLIRKFKDDEQVSLFDKK